MCLHDDNEQKVEQFFALYRDCVRDCGVALLKKKTVKLTNASRSSRGKVRNCVECRRVMILNSVCLHGNEQKVEQFFTLYRNCVQDRGLARDGRDHL